ncbi:hypothetical protein [Pseudoroseicyclus aestuarii]|uniref:N-acetyltransferase domain-containing protein n=1 Tax=Pseudoroseicyclus aestuarii TaxID=1795041 RepID=A0A318SNW1_9RHOB|nr:hypothetical protein [Pseudoroseicyclus aestuarii]PYE82503.1 hypothetical protein DFP88_104260 [Pseudoroseicyclus aestuarii]
MQDYLHRHLRTPSGSLIGGIRFFGQDIRRPFVEVVAHDFDNLDTLRDAVRLAWAGFAPHALQLRDLPGLIRAPDARLDQTIHAARHDAMTPADGRVWLRPFADSEPAEALLRQRFRRLAQDDPALAADIQPAAPRELRVWHAEGMLRAIVPRGRQEPAGLIAIRPDRCRWITGDVVQEEAVAAHHAGRGYAAAAQAAWAAEVAPDRSRLMIGTIDGRNAASRISARRAGREAVLEEVFLPLDRGRRA